MGTGAGARTRDSIEVASDSAQPRSCLFPCLPGVPGVAARAATSVAAGSGCYAAGSSTNGSLTVLAECHQALLAEIAGYLADTPRDITALASQSSRTVASQLLFAMRQLWRAMYAGRWPAFADSLVYQGVEDWRALYKDTLMGRCECMLEVFDREKKLGFSMSAMPARVQYDARVQGYVARYLSASALPPETIPYSEGHRLRFCPTSARERLQPGRGGAAGGDCGQGLAGPGGAAVATPYPYQVLEGVEDLQVGQGVELQWRMQLGSPFGWWYGQLDELHRDPRGKLATATITFRHFPASSRLHRLEVCFGDSELRPCEFGGFTGGVRAASETERALWTCFFPKKPVVF